MMYMLSNKLYFWKSYLLIWLSFTISQSVVAHENIVEQRTKTNLEIVQTLIGKITQSVVKESKLFVPDTIEIKFHQITDVWIVKEAVTSTLINLGYTLFFKNDSLTPKKYQFDIVSYESNIQYDSMFRESIFGEKKLKRTISARLTIQATNNKTGEVLLSKSLNEHSSDTVALNEIFKYELASSKSTQGEIPPENMLDRFIEPFIIIGATGVAVFLFFHIRTQ